MNSRDVYAALRAHLAPTFKAAGFKRANAMLSWARPQRARQLVVWCQVSQAGWDDYVGSKFVVEFQVSDEPVVGAKSIFRRRFGKMLDAEEREEVRGLQNQVIASLRSPPSNHPMLRAPEKVRTWYLDQFKRIDRPYSDQDDIWFRYAKDEHIATWADLIIRKLPNCFDEIERAVPE